MNIIDGVNKEIDYLRLRQLYEEFTKHWSRIQAYYLDAVAGFYFIRLRVDEEQMISRNLVRGSDLDSEAFQDTRMFSYSNIFPEDFCTSGIHRSTQGEVKCRNAPKGDNFTILGQLCLVSFYDYWNEYLRREYAIAKGYLDPNEKCRKIIDECLRVNASHDLWGDIRLLRNSVVHHLGKATSDVSRCKIIKFFAPGDMISLTPDHMRSIFLALLRYGNELHKETIPSSYITI